MLHASILLYCIAVLRCNLEVWNTLATSNPAYMAKKDTTLFPVGRAHFVLASKSAHFIFFLLHLKYKFKKKSLKKT